MALEFLGEKGGEGWKALARCHDGTGSLVKLYFSEKIDDVAAAKAFCAECPVGRICLEGALERREPWGVWGGELLANGKIVTQKRKPGGQSRQRIIGEGIISSPT